MKFLFALAMLLASTGACMAEPEFCDIPIDPSLGRIVAPSRVHFLSGRNGCPSEAPRCVLPSYVVRGDVVLLGRKTGAWQCAMYPNEMLGTDGFLPVTALQVLPSTPNPPLTAWVGHWVRDKDAHVDITREGTKLSVHGMAFWQGSNRYDLRDGELEGKVRPKGDTLLLDDREPGETLACVATLTLAGRDLIVEDNDECGGVNVSFNGVYRRR